MQKEDLKVLVDQTQFQRLGKEFCLVRMANRAKGQAGDFAFLASGKLCSTLQKQFSICFIFIWNNWIMNFYCQSRAASHAKQAALIPQQDLFMLAQDFAELLRVFFHDFQIQLLMRNVHPSTKI